MVVSSDTGVRSPRSFFHRKEVRIRAHVLLCWLALLRIRIAENPTQDTWRKLSNEFDRMHLVTLGTAHGRVGQRSLPTARHRSILTALELPEPPGGMSADRPACRWRVDGQLGGVDQGGGVAGQLQDGGRQIGQALARVEAVGILGGRLEVGHLGPAWPRRGSS